MPTHKQITVDPKATEYSVGSSSTTDHQQAFPASPIHNGELTEETLQAMFEELVIAETVDDGGHTFGEFNRDYVEAPNLEEVETGGAGLPGSPYAPNVASAPAADKPSDIPDSGAEVTQNRQGGGSPHPGDGLASPSKTSKDISRQTVGSLIFGDSEPQE